MVKDLILALQNSRAAQKNNKDTKTEEDRRIIMQLLGKERDLDCYSDSESETDYEYQSCI